MHRTTFKLEDQEDELNIADVVQVVSFQPDPSGEQLAPEFHGVDDG